MGIFNQKYEEFPTPSSSFVPPTMHLDGPPEPDSQPDIIEKAARAIALNRWRSHVSWENLTENIRALYLSMAEVAILSVADDLRAEGMVAGARQALLDAADNLNNPDGATAPIVVWLRARAEILNTHPPKEKIE